MLSLANVGKKLIKFTTGSVATFPVATFPDRLLVTCRYAKSTPSICISNTLNACTGFWESKRKSSNS